MNREDLPVNKHKEKIIEAVKNNKVVVIEAPTGSGKTTQIPQILYNSGIFQWGIIGVTQPRRIAAFGVSTRIAEEMQVELGRLVGYKVRFDDYTSENTQIKIMTDGILLEELRSDFLLLKYSIVIVDEAHERSLNIDFVLGLLKQILAQREDFKVIVSSATINARLFSDFFNNAPIISIDARTYPVDIKYLPLKRVYDSEEIQLKIVDIITSLETEKKTGDVLIFLEGENSIKECYERLSILAHNNNYYLEILPLYSRLSHDEQRKVFNSFPDKRKIVIATNIAETSITIDGIIYVIDSGLSKLNFYNPRTFTSFLESKPISRASCDQRKGRAGRTAPGIVYRLYSETDFFDREEYTKEEIYRTDLSEVVLRMADLGISHYSEFDFISAPREGAILSAIDTLILIGALDDNQKLTETGKKMVEFPLEPRLSRILLESLLKFPNVLNCALIIISFLSTKSPFLYPLGEEIESRNAQKKLFQNGGDFFTWLNLFYKYNKTKEKEKFCKDYYLDLRSMTEILNIHEQLTEMLHERNYKIKDSLDYEEIICCIGAGLKQFICKKDKKKRNTYYSVTEKDIRIHPGSFLFGLNPEWLIGGEIVNTGRTYIRTSAQVNEKIIKLRFPDVYFSINKKNVFKRFVTTKEIHIERKEKIEEKKRIYILDKYFDLNKDKNGIYAIIPYHIIIQIKNKKEDIIDFDFGNLNAKLIFKDKVILTDKLNSLIQYFDKIDLDNGLNVKWPKNEFFLYPDDWNGIFRYIKLLLKPTLPGQKSIYTGFLCIKIQEENVYQYYLEKDFFNAVEISIEAIEKIFESEVIAWSEKEKIIMESVYHNLLNLSEETDNKS